MSVRCALSTKIVRTATKVRVAPIRTPGREGMGQPKARGRRRDAVVDFKCIAELEELRSWSRVDLHCLPIPQIIPHCIVLFSDLRLQSGCKRQSLQAPAKSSLCMTFPRPQLFFRFWIAVGSPLFNMLSTCSMTAWTSAEQFWGILRRMGSKYCQKFLFICKFQRFYTIFCCC